MSNLFDPDYPTWKVEVTLDLKKKNNKNVFFKLR